MSPAKSAIITAPELSDIIAFEWHDGPIKGLLIESSSNDALYFTLLDCNDSMDTRVFAFYKSDRSIYDDCVAELSRIEEPKRPIWCPTVSPGQVKFAKWSVSDRNRLKAIAATTPYLERVIKWNPVDPQDLVDATEWNPDDEKPNGFIADFLSDTER